MKGIGKIVLLLFVTSVAVFLYVNHSEAKSSVRHIVNNQSGNDKSLLMKHVLSRQIPFIENQGQIKDPSVKFYAALFDGTVVLNEKGDMVYTFIRKEHLPPTTNSGNCDSGDHNRVEKSVAVKETLLCPEPITMKGLKKPETSVHYFIGAREEWKSNIPAWQEVNLGEVYKGIELNLRTYGISVEKVFTVNRGAEVEDIKLSLEGVKGLRVNKDGELEIETELGILKMTKPVAYQEEQGKKKFINVAYNVPEDSVTYGFEVGTYDRTKPLIIDPLLASTFAGEAAADIGNAIAIDANGNVFVAGTTGADIFIRKFSNDLSVLLASTVIGGSETEEGNAMAIDSSGKVYISGGTRSANYPVTTGVAYKSSFDVVVSKFSNDLSVLEASTMIGGFG